MKNNIKNVVIKPAKNKSKTMRLNRFLSNRYILALILVVVDIFFFLLMNYVVNSSTKITSIFSNPDLTFGIKNILFPLTLFKTHTAIKWLYLILLLLLIIIDLRISFMIRMSLSDNNFNVGQKGVSRWTTIEEIKEQYKEIDEKDTFYTGSGGTIVARYKNKLYLDTSPTNNLFIGTTRSGKGEMFVFPSIDVYSRAEIKPDLIVADPKIELFKSSKETLEKRGYDVHLLNLMDPLYSMGYSPLSIIIESYKNKDYANAELLAQTLAYSYFNPDSASGDMKFFATTASGLFTAMILAAIDDCIKEDEIINEQRYEEFLSKREAFNNLDNEFKDEAIELYKKKLSEFNEESKDLILDDSIEYIPSDVDFHYLNNNEKKINLYSIINTFTELARVPIPNTTNKSAIDLYFSNRPELDRAKLKYASVEVAGDRTKGSVFAEMLSKLSVFTYDNVAKMTAETSIDLNSIGFGDKPVAIFMGIPDFDKSLHFLVTAFIRQVYFILARKCGDKGKCKKHVKFILDEFGNIPAIESMETIITVCLGRNISFDLYVQAYSQLDSLYDDDAKTITGNCGNQIYILTNDYDTAEAFSKLLGNESIIDVQRSGFKLSLNKHFTESVIDKPLLNPNELMELELGECVIKRVMKRDDLKRNHVKPRPIYNSYENGQRFKFRYEYLKNSFPDPIDIDLKSVNYENRSHINHRERVWDYNITFKHFEEQEENEENKSSYKKENEVKRLKNISTKTYDSLINTLIKYFGSNYEKEFNISTDMPISKFVDFINNSNLKSAEKKAIIFIINEGEI